MTTEEVIQDIVRREGAFVDHKHDRGGPTNFGITAQTLGAWRALGRQATRAEVQALTEQEAAEIYRRRYIENPHFDRIVNGPLRALLVDWGVHSGPQTAIKALQRVVGVPADGIIGPVTLGAVEELSGDRVQRLVLRARGEFLAALMQRDVSQRAFAAGWLRRLMEFV